jgi:hypothetical protein
MASGSPLVGHRGSGVSLAAFGVMPGRLVSGNALGIYAAGRGRSRSRVFATGSLAARRCGPRSLLVRATKSSKLQPTTTKTESLATRLGVRASNLAIGPGDVRACDNVC